MFVTGVQTCALPISFYSSANQRYLEGIMRDVRSGKAHFAPHDLIEEA